MLTTHSINPSTRSGDNWPYTATSGRPTRRRSPVAQLFYTGRHHIRHGVKHSAQVTLDDLSGRHADAKTVKLRVTRERAV